MRSTFVTALLLAALSLSALPEARAQTYTYFPNDTTINSGVGTDYVIVGYAGGSYNADFTRNFTGPSSPTIQFVTGADISGEVDSFNHSVVNVTDGNVPFIIPMDSSTLNFSGGSSLFVLGQDAATINMSGGNVADLEGQGRQINVRGGTVGTLVANTNTDYLGNPLGSSIVDVRGGSITGDADAYNDGILNIHGGLFGGDLYARFGGTINFFGAGLSATLLDPNYQNTYSLYSLSGVLADGSVLTDKNLFIENDGVTYGHSSFNIINAVPEPGALALLAGGISSSGLIVLRRKRANIR